MPVFTPTHIKIRVEFVTRPKKKVTAQDISRRLLSWGEISHEMEATLGAPGEVGKDILGIDMNGAASRDWYWDSSAFPFALGSDTEMVPGSGRVKITYTVLHNGESHVDTACYPLAAVPRTELDDVLDPEVILRQTAPDVFKLIFPAANDSPVVPICQRLKSALEAVPPDSLSAASYRIALITNIC